MPIPQPLVTRSIGPAPAKSPLGVLETEPEVIRLGIPSIGSVEISVSGIHVVAPTVVLLDHTWSALGGWAKAQWLMTQGFCVMRGSAVAKDDKVLVLRGDSGVGVSVTAAQLTRHGWGIVSDGIVVIDAIGRALSSEPTVRIDTFVAERLFPEVPRIEVPSIRERSHLTFPGHDDAEVTHYAGIVVRDSAPGLSVSQAVPNSGEAEGPPARLRWKAHLPVAMSFTPPSGISYVVVRPRVSSAEDGPRFGPRALTQALADALEAS